MEKVFQFYRSMTTQTVAETVCHPEGKILLMNGTALECYPKPDGAVPADDGWEELFLKEAFFLYEHKDRILSDSRMFLTPTPFKNELAYSGSSWMGGATLGVYLEWWDACEKSVLKYEGDIDALTYRIAGSPLSGSNSCSAVTRDGKTFAVHFPVPFSEIWSSFSRINQRYTEAKQRYQAYTLEETLVKLREALAMERNRFTHFSDTLAESISLETRRITRLFQHVLNDMRDPGKTLPEEFTAGKTRDHLFMAVVRNMAGDPEAQDVQSQPEETMASLIRQGVPKDNISATFKYLDADLPNASYRLYRKNGGHPAGAIRITRNGCFVYIRSTLVPDELARFLLLLDARLPEIDEAAYVLFDELQQMFLMRQKENMALVIARKSVEAQLADVLPGMGITGKFEISDGRVRLNLTRTYTAEVELPLEALPEFLSEPGRVEASLKVKPVSPEPERGPVFPQSFPPKCFSSKITVKPR